MTDQKKPDEDAEVFSPPDEGAGASGASEREAGEELEKHDGAFGADPESKNPAADDDVTPFDDDKTDAAIDDIVAKEGDTLLAAQDAGAAVGGVAYKRKKHWRATWFWWGLTILVVGGITIFVLLSTVRYWVLNMAGVRVESSVTIVDEATRLPLKGIQFSVNGKHAQTNKDGQATVRRLKLGPQALTIEQNGFASVKRNVVLGWGSNPLGTVALKAVGVRYTIEVRDYLSDKPIQGVEATNGDATAFSDKNGKITLTLPNSVTGEKVVILTKVGYRVQDVVLAGDLAQATKATLVTDRKVVFVTKQTGTYDVYKTDADGQNKELLLAGTGKETSNIALVASPDGSHAALVSTRSDKRDAGGSLLSSLVLINVKDGNAVTLADASQIKLIDWIGSRLIFEQISSDNLSKNRSVVISYSYKDTSRVQLAAAHTLSTVLAAQGAVYFVVAPSSEDESLHAGLFKIDANGNGKQTIQKDEVWSVLRDTYDSFQIQLADNSWQTYTLSTGLKKPLDVSSGVHRYYLDNVSRTKSLRISQGSLFIYDNITAKETMLKTDSALSHPVRWLTDNTVLYRVSSRVETADYALSILGGTPHKIADVATTYGFSQAQ